MAQLSAKWIKVAQADELRRSSHTVSVSNGEACIFGGELQARQPRDNKVFKVRADGTMSTQLLEVNE